MIAGVRATRLSSVAAFACVAGLALAGPLSIAGSAAASTSAAPYTDPNAVGSIGLCNQAGQQITSGSVTARPFAWRAVSTQPAQAPYNDAGRTAILVAYQPLQGLPPGDWSGTQLTASSRYSNPANPMAAATAGDLSLNDVIEQYQPKWDGFLQLRIYLGTAQQSGYTLHYPSLDIQVTGDTWKAIGGASVNCASGTAESIESILLPTTTTPANAATSPTSSGAGVGASASTTSSTATPSAQHGSADPALAPSAPAAEATGKTNVPLLLAIGLAILLVLAASTLLVLRKRRLTSASSGSTAPLDSPTSTSTKGDTQ